jgi:hypothetical protein
MFFGILKHPGGAACLREEYCTASAGALLAVVGRTGLRLLCYLVRSVSAGKCYFSANDCRIKSGNIWDAFQAAADEPEAAPGATGGLSYAFPSVMDGLALSASYTPSNGNADSSTSFGAVYTGVEGLTLTYAIGSDNNNATSEADHTVMAATYAYGPITIAVMQSEYDDAVAAGDQTTDAYSVAYTVSDGLSISYGSEELEFGVQSSSQVAAEFERIKVSYTAGGMTLTASSATGDNIDYSTTATKDQEVWALGASFAF